MTSECNCVCCFQFFIGSLFLKVHFARLFYLPVITFPHFPYIGIASVTENRITELIT